MVKNYEKQFKGKLIALCTYRKHTFRAIDMARKREKDRNTET